MYKIEKLEKKIAQNGKEYFVITLDGKNYTYFGDVTPFTVGDTVIAEFQTNGKFTNLVSITKAEPQKVVMPSASPTQTAQAHQTVEKIKPHSYEFGNPGNRHKIYYDTVKELKEHIEFLKEGGFLNE